jgi:hypothetical protein
MSRHVVVSLLFGCSISLLRVSRDAGSCAFRDVEQDNTSCSSESGAVIRYSRTKDSSM